MLRASITFEDSADGGEVIITAKYEPPLKRGEKTTPAQDAAGDVFEWLADRVRKNQDRLHAEQPRERKDGE
jgi:hypothetical protein